VLRERGLRIVGMGEQTVLEPKLVSAAELTAPFDLVVLTVRKRAGLGDRRPGAGGRPGDDDPAGYSTACGTSTRWWRGSAERPVLGGVAKVAATIDANGDIARLADLGSMTYGVRDWAAGPSADELHRTLSGVGFDTELSADITGEMWAKWVFIASIAAVNCLARATIGEVIAEPGGARFAEAVVAEGAAVRRRGWVPVCRMPRRRIARGAVTAQGSVATASLYRDLTTGQRVEGEADFRGPGGQGERVGRAGPAAGVGDAATARVSAPDWTPGPAGRDTGCLPVPESRHPDRLGWRRPAPSRPAEGGANLARGGRHHLARSSQNDLVGERGQPAGP